MTKRAVLYARLSTSTDESVSIKRQLDAGRDYCAAQGWEVVGEHVDDGVSASARAPEQRKGWQALMERPNGSFDVALVWKSDRLARKTLDFLRANEALQAKGAAVAAVEDPIDMSTPTGRAVATVSAAFAEMEAEGIRARVRAARRTLIKQGRVPGGAAPFGYYNATNPDGPGKVVAKDPRTITFVTEAAARALRGDSINSVAAYLDQVAPRTGRKNSAAHWTVTVTKRMLLNPILAGMTSHNPGNSTKERGSDVLRDKTGMPIVREDLAVLSSEEFRALKARLITSEPYATRTSSYLAGLVWCGHCDRRMYRNVRTVNGKTVHVFQCQGKEGCGQQVSHLEDIVEEMFLERYGDLPMVRFEHQDSGQDLAEVNHQIADTLARMSEDGADVMALAERLQSLKIMRSQTPDRQSFEQVLDQTVADWWEDDRREALLSYFEGVRLTKGKVGRKFDPNRLAFIQTKRIRIDPTAVAMDDPDALATAIRMANGPSVSQLTT